MAAKDCGECRDTADATCRTCQQPVSRKHLVLSADHNQIVFGDDYAEAYPHAAWGAFEPVTPYMCGHCVQLAFRERLAAAVAKAEAERLARPAVDPEASWADEVAAAKQAKQAAEAEQIRLSQVAEKAASQARRDQDALVAELRRVHRALEAAGWPGSAGRRKGLHVRHLVEMLIPEIHWSGTANRDQSVELTARVSYRNYQRDDRRSDPWLIAVSAGGRGKGVHIGDVSFRSSEDIGKLNPALVRRAAARYCAEHDVLLDLSEGGCSSTAW